MKEIKTDNASSGRMSLLLVDDNPQNLQVLGKQLIDREYDIEFAINGQIALEWVENKHFDLILLDINMPGMSGFDVCRKIRANPALKSIPVIFLSADSDRESILKGFELGAQDYITKPFDSRELLVRVSTHLALKNALENLEILNHSLEQKVIERTNQLREANARLEEAYSELKVLDKAKSDFLNLISHEIRTPLNGIMGPVELLKGPVYASEIGGLIEILDASVNRLERFANDALLITRLKTNEKGIVKKDVSLSKAFSSVLEGAGKKLMLKNIKVINNINLRSDSVKGEEGLVIKALDNVFDNAIIFSPEGGTIEVKSYSENSDIVLEIKDQGSGFKTEKKKFLSELFTYADKYRDNSKGIGLPVVKLIMEAHSGDILAGNHPQGGALVKLIFPG